MIQIPTGTTPVALSTLSPRDTFACADPAGLYAVAEADSSEYGVEVMPGRIPAYMIAGDHRGRLYAMQPDSTVYPVAVTMAVTV